MQAGVDTVFVMLPIIPTALLKTKAVGFIFSAHPVMIYELLHLHQPLYSQSNLSIYSNPSN
jgi:hypothetical protein